MKKIIIVSAGIAIAMAACNANQKDETKAVVKDTTTVTGNVFGNDYDPNKGLGKYTAENLKVDPYLDVKMAERGEKTYQAKCAPCHKTTDDKLVGPGWKGITERRTPHWLMNYIINPHPMLAQDPNLKKLVDSLKVVMPNLGVKDDEARDILEYMRKVDGVKPQ